MKPKILMIDDERIFIQGWKRMLEPQYEVCACYSPEEAMSANNYYEYKYILVDYHFSRPDKSIDKESSLKIQRHISKICPWVPIILLTAYADDPESCNVFNRARWHATIHKKTHNKGAVALLEMILERFNKADEHSEIWLKEDYPREFNNFHTNEKSCESLLGRLNALELALSHLKVKRYQDADQNEKDKYDDIDSFKIQFLACVFMKYTDKNNPPPEEAIKLIEKLSNSHNKIMRSADKKTFKKTLIDDYGITASEPSAWSQDFTVESRGKLSIEAFRFRHLIIESFKKNEPNKWELTCTYYKPARKLVIALGLNHLEYLSHIKDNEKKSGNECSPGKEKK